MNTKPVWNPLTEWKHTDVDWVRVNISKEDLKRFTTRSNIKGLAMARNTLGWASEGPGPIKMRAVGLKG